MATATPDRVAVYIDGFNLYFGLKESGWRKLYWLDMGALASELLKPGQRLALAKYFTARVSGALPLDTRVQQAASESKRRRQEKYLAALAAMDNVEIIEGHYQSSPRRCQSCGATNYRHEEKKTDVSIATEMLRDGFKDRYDVALLVSADSDLVPPIEALHSLFSSAKKIVAVFPPKRVSNQLKKCCDGFIFMNRAQLTRCQLPHPVPDGKGGAIVCPAEWR